MSDQCLHCTNRGGDRRTCETAPCSIVDSWYSTALRTERDEAKAKIKLLEYDLDGQKEWVSIYKTENAALRTERDEARAKLALVESADATLHLMAENKQLRERVRVLAPQIIAAETTFRVANIARTNGWENAVAVATAALAAGREEG